MASTSLGQELLDSLRYGANRATSLSDKVGFLNELAYQYRLSNRDSAFYYNDRAQELSMNLDDKIQREVIFKRARIFDHLGEIDSTIAIYKNILKQDTSTFADEVGRILFNLGVIYRNNGSFEESLSHLLKAADYYRKYNPREEYEAFSQISLLYNNFHDCETGLIYGWKAKALYEKLEDPPSSRIYNNLGVLHMCIRNYDSCIYYYNKGYNPDKLPENSEMHGIYRHNVAYVLETKGEKRKGIEMFKEALKFKEKYNSEYSKSLTYHALAETYYDFVMWFDGQKDFLDSAVFYCEKALKIAQTRNDIQLQKKVHGQLSSIYAATGDRKYLMHKELFMNYTDSLFNRERSSIIADMDSKYQLKEREAENLKLTNENLQREAVINRQNNLFIGAVVIILLIGGILLIVYRNNQKIKALNTQIETSNRTKDRLFSIISHDLRGPISAFETTPRLLKNFLDKNQPEKVAEMVEHIDRSAKSINQLLDNLLNWSVSQREELVVNIERLEIKPIIDEIISVFSDVAKLKNVIIQSTITDQCIMADRNTFATVVRNLLSNAIKFSHPGSTITIGHRISENWIEFTFSDTGTGMTEDQLEKLFSIDKSKVRSGTAREKGTGLGMVLVKEFVEINKGEIRVESKPEVGTTFYVSLPLAS